MSRQYAFRLPVYLVERIDRYAAMRARVDGRKCTRSDALHLLLEKGLALEIPAKMNKGPAFETPARTVSGLVTDSFELPPAAKKKQQPPYRRPGRPPGLAFSQATERLEGRKKKP